MHDVGPLAIPATPEELVDPARAALLVYDMQVGIVGQVGDGAATTAQVARVLAAARRAGVRTFFSRHLSLPKPLMGVMQYRMAMGWQRTDDPAKVQPWFLRDAPGFGIVPELAPTADEGVLDKITMSALEGTWLPIALRDAGITTLVIAGIATEIGIEPTARHAADLGIVPVLVTDACGHGDAEAAERSLAALRFAGDTVMTDVATIEAQWGAA